VWEHYLGLCALNEHFLEYRQVVKREIEAQLAEYMANEAGLQGLPTREESVSEAIAS
jgi:hypothetical protein